MIFKAVVSQAWRFIHYYRIGFVLAAVIALILIRTLSDNSQVAGAGFTFPYNNPTSISFNSADLRQSWADWKAGHITTSNAGAAPRQRVMGGTSISDTVSEGQAYGILFASIFDEQSLLDGLWLFAADHLDANGLMHWKIGGYRQVTGTGAATDADVDMAIGLINACMKVRQGTWSASTNGLDYCALAREMVGDIWQHEVDHPGPGPSGGLSNNAGYELIPGDSWNLRNEYPEGITNLSYFAPGYFRVFASFTGNTGWNRVIERGYEIVDLAQAKPGNCSKLISNWNQYDGDPQVVSWQGNTSTYFGWDGARFAWRVAVDRAWYNSSEARETMNEVGGFFASVGASNVLTEYQLNGVQVQNYKTAFFVANASSAIWAAPAPIATNCGQATSSIKSSAQEAYSQTVNTREAGTGNNSTYYNNAWRLLSMLLMTGNFPSLYTANPGNPANTATPTKTATPVVTQVTAIPTISASASPTPIAPTKTPGGSATPVPPTAVGSTTLRVQYRVPELSAGDNTIRAHLQIVNGGSSSVPLNEIALRYYFTKEVGGALLFNCDWAAVGCGKLQTSFVTLSAPLNGADTYLEIRFAADAGTLAPGASTGELQVRINKVDWSNFNEGNDYSYNATATAYADWNKVVVIRGSAVIWGTAPGGAATSPTATRTVVVNPTNTPVPPVTAEVTIAPSTSTTVPASTKVPATVVPSSTPTTQPPTVQPPAGNVSLKAQYRLPEISVGDNAIRANLQIVNAGSAGVPLSEIAVRYYFTKEPGAALVFNCDWAAVGCNNLQGKFVSLPSPVNGADTVLELRFSGAAGTLQPGKSTGEIQVRLNKSDWSNFNESNDYSFNLNASTFADWNKVVIVRGTTVIWGVAPK